MYAMSWTARHSLKKLHIGPPSRSSDVTHGLETEPLDIFGENLRVLPLRPIWLGLAANTIFYSAALWLLTLGPFTARRIIRRRRGHCPQCAYDLRGNPGGSCPECGWRREDVP